MTIFEMLALSEQSTKQEMTAAYTKEFDRLSNMVPSSEEEARLLQKKKKELTWAYEAGQNQYQNADVVPITTETYQKTRKKDKEIRMYSIHGPIYWLLGCCDKTECCTCSCCGNDGGRGCCVDCYNECFLFSLTDTVIVLVGGFAAVCGVVYGIYRAIRAIGDAKREKTRKDLESREEQLERELETNNGIEEMYKRAYGLIEKLDQKQTGDAVVDKEFSKTRQTIQNLNQTTHTRQTELREELSRVRRKLARY